VLTVFKNSTVSRRSLMLQPSLADVSKLAPLPQLRQTCEILFGCKQTCQKLREFFVYKDAVGYKSDENSSRLRRDRVALRTTLVCILLRSPDTDYRATTAGRQRRYLSSTKVFSSPAG
jgi:hypothetical protein